jgi:hypothetical protein
MDQACKGQIIQWATRDNKVQTFPRFLHTKTDITENKISAEVRLRDNY